MNTRTLALIIVFVALTSAINIFSPKIPFPPAPFLYYNLWEIPIVVAFLLFGPQTGFSIAVLNTLILLISFPGNLPTGPFYNFIAVIAMLLGVFTGYKIATYNCPKEKISDFLKRHALGLSISMTVLGIITRVAITTVTNYFLIEQPSPIGFGSFFPFGGFTGHAAIIAFLPFSVLFNATQALFTIPIGLVVAIAVVSRFKIQ
jgi:riboflavin transporter FmnP